LKVTQPLRTADPQRQLPEADFHAATGFSPPRAKPLSGKQKNTTLLIKVSDPHGPQGPFFLLNAKSRAQLQVALEGRSSC
jgi:hypothetical protein